VPLIGGDAPRKGGGATQSGILEEERGKKRREKERRRKTPKGEEWEGKGKKKGGKKGGRLRPGAKFAASKLDGWKKEKKRDKVFLEKKRGRKQTRYSRGKINARGGEGEKKGEERTKNSSVREKKGRAYHIETGPTGGRNRTNPKRERRRTGKTCIKQEKEKRGKERSGGRPSGKSEGGGRGGNHLEGTWQGEEEGRRGGYEREEDKL